MLDPKQMLEDLQIAMETARETATKLNTVTLIFNDAQWSLEEAKINQIVQSGDSGINEYELTLKLKPEREKLQEASRKQSVVALQNHLAELMVKQVEYQIRIVEALYKPIVSSAEPQLEVFID